MKTSRLIAIVCLVLAVGGNSLPVFADPKSPASAAASARAKTYFENGARLVGEQRYAEALAEFSAGFELSQRPLFLFNMGEAARALGDAARARTFYRHYLTLAPNGEFAQQARARLDALATPAPQPTPSSPSAATTQPLPVTHVQTSQPATTPDLTPSHALTHEPAPLPVQTRAPIRVVLVTDEDSRPLWKKPVLWISVGAAIVVGSAAIYLAERSGSSGCGEGCVSFR